ncbi:MAG: glycosyltransferase family 4 protein [Methanomicrobiales archaeon]|nr:glycosyltransferase family 4 protein [Methanomicrobiales archaeon]MDI6876915.1 glycosyltransferase family 4 protein [Methanomicrobiales archaeon]
MRIAYFSPVSPQKTGIADYSECELLPYLSRYMDIDIFIDINVKPDNGFLIENFDIYPYTEYERLKGYYDIPLYHMGNNQLHEFIYRSLIKNPGITVFHDIYLHGFLSSISIARGNADRYREEFGYCYGEKGVMIADRAIQAKAYPDFEYPLIRRILDNSLGIVCHNEFCVQTALREKHDISIAKINHPMTIPKEIREVEKRNIKAIKNKLSIPEKNPIIISFGYISPHKRYHVLLNSFKNLLNDYPDAVLLLVGEDLMRIDGLIARLGLDQSVIKTGFVPFAETLNYLAIADYCVNLRHPTAGETSGSILRIMAAKKPVIVSDVGWFSEIPDDCCLKVAVDSYEEDLLLAYMQTLAANARMRETIGENALRWVEREHNPDRIAKEFYRYIKSVVDGDEIVMTQISEALLDLGVDEQDDNLLGHVSKTIRDVL